MPETTLLLSMGAMLLAIGAFAGVLAGLLGVGGGIVLVPAFFYAFAEPCYESPQLMQICLATSLATIVVTSARSVLSHNRKGAVDWPSCADGPPASLWAHWRGCWWSRSCALRCCSSSSAGCH